MKVAVVTPTIGAEELEECISSVQNQTYQNLTHYIFLDGQEYYDKIHPILYEQSGKRRIKTVSLEQNIGKGWCGHRVYAACSFLVDADVICYLDQDNWYESDHVEKLMEKIQNGNDWAYSLRNIVDADGNFLFQDNCESLGIWPVYTNENVFHIDTSCFAVKRDVAVRIGHTWYDEKHKMSADRTFFYHLKHYFPKFSCTRAYTLNYRLGGEQGVPKDFFINGNEMYSVKYNGEYPWNKPEEPLIEVIDTTQNLY
jgi:glycosyltransferase involved in cell wall biosynthesis